MGSAITVTNESYLSNTYNSYRGRVVAYVKAINDQEKNGTIKISNSILEDKEIKVEVTK